MDTVYYHVIRLQHRNSFAVIAKLHNLLIQQSIPLLGFEEKLELIESKLNEVTGEEHRFFTKNSSGDQYFQKNFGDIVCDIEEVIDIIGSLEAEKRKMVGIFPFLFFLCGGLNNQRSGFERGILFVMHCGLAVNVLIHRLKLQSKLDEITGEIFTARRILRGGGGSWSCSFMEEMEYDEAIFTESIISPVVNKVITLSTQADVSFAVRKKARKLRDNLSVVQVWVNYLDSQHLIEYGIDLVEEIFIASLSVEDAINLFMHGREQLSKSWKVPFLNLALAFDSFNSQKKLCQEMEKININLEGIIRSLNDQQMMGIIPRKTFPFYLANKAPASGDIMEDDQSMGTFIAGFDDRDEDEQTQDPSLSPARDNEQVDDLLTEEAHSPGDILEDTESLAIYDDDDDDDSFGDDFDVPSHEDASSWSPARNDEQVDLQANKASGDEMEDAESFSTSFDDDKSREDVKLSSSPQAEQTVNEEQVDIAGFEHDVDDIMEVLLRDDPKCLTISIVGIDGIGQREVARLVYEHPATRNHFPHRVWVPRAYFHILVEQILGVQFGFCGYSELTSPLKQVLMENKHLIIIDKVHPNWIFWNDVHEACDGLSNGTRVIFITYEPYEYFVGQKLTPEVSDRNLIYRMHLRNDDESWAMLTNHMKMNIPPNLLKLKRKILRQCGGLPTIIRNLAAMLSQKDATLEECSSVLDQLSQVKEPWSGALYKIDKRLPLYLRRCLYYFGLFPQDLEITVRRLIALWVAEGLGRQKGDEESPESVSEKCLMELVDQNVIQVAEKKLNGKIKTCRLPYALRMHWLPQAKAANFLPDNSNTIDSGGIVRRLADHLDCEDPSYNDIHGNYSSTSSHYSRYREVISFMSFDSREDSIAGEDIGNFLDRCINTRCFLFLWVLDLENVYKPKLPKAVGQLIRLRYFGLRSTYLVMLPLFINKLLNLQTLDLKRTHIHSLPSSIWKMKKLRHLYLDDTSRTIFLPRPKGSSTTLAHLRTLWGAYLNEESPVKNGLDTLLNIKKLGLVCRISIPSQKEAMSLQLDAIATWISNLKHLQCLRLKSFDESNQPWNLHVNSLSGHVDLTSTYLAGKLKNQQLISEFPKNLIELTLSASGLSEDPMQTLNKLPNLKILIMLLGSFTGRKMLCSSRGFRKLEILKLKKLVQLEEWNVEEGALPNLKNLEIDSCSNLKTLPDGIRLVKTLHELKVSKMPVIASRIKDSHGEDWMKIAQVHHICIEDRYC